MCYEQFQAMKMSLKETIIILLILLTISSCQESTTYDLAIRNVQVFDAETKEVLSDKTILITGDHIAQITDADSPFESLETIEGNGRLVTPGLIDTHIHFGDLYGNYDEAPEYLQKDSIAYYQKQLADTYLVHGITSVAVMGQPEKWIAETVKWQNNTTGEIPNVYVTGGAIISDEERDPYQGHIEVIDPEDARKKVREFYEVGITHIKLYWRLRQPEMEAAIAEANALGMNIFAHSDNNIVPMRTVLDLGIKNFEHALTSYIAAFLPSENDDALTAIMKEHYPNTRATFPYLLEQIQFIEDSPKLKEKRDALLQRMVDKKVSLSTTIHLFGSIVKRTFFNTYIDNFYTDQNPDLSEYQLERLNKGFDTFMGYIKDAHDRGLKLRLGTDCKEGGKAALSELLLLHEAGFSMGDALQIATLNGAEALKIDRDFGSIKIGKKADLVIFKNNPFENPQHLLSEKLIVKSGKVYK